MSEYIKKYYNRYDEDSRLDRKHTKIEFLTTVEYVNKYLRPGMRLLEVGAATGRYSLHFANKGYQVDSIELVEHNINIFKSKIKPEHNINLQQGNALDLNMYKDNTFDVTLILGPMYHMYTIEDKNQVVKEALRVTKQGGKVCFAYISHDAVIVSWGLLDGNLNKENVSKMFTDDYKCLSTPEELFSMFHVEEFNELVNKYNINHLHTVATDGVAPFFPEQFKELSDEVYEEWIKYHLFVCEREDLMGFSNHILYIGEKK